MKQNWNWQNRALKAIQKHTGKHFWVDAPTGTGKTNLIYKVIEKGTQGTNSIIMVGLDSVVTQHRDRFVSLGVKPLYDDPDCAVFETKKGNTVTIATWQGLYRFEEKPLLKVDYLFFDECHLGGSSEDNKSFPAIIERFKPKKKVYLSATTFLANEELLGKKEGNCFKYTVTEAYDDGLLNPVDLVEVQVGQRVDITAIEQSLGRNVEKIQEFSDDDLMSLAKKMKDQKVILDAESFKQLAADRAEAMMRIYLEKHAGEPAIFYATNISRAGAALRKFKSLCRANRVSISAATAHSRETNFGEVINDFRDGKIMVIFVVGMLQEGFDMPSLRLAFDCRFCSKQDLRRQGRMMQRIGRLTRRSDVKDTSLYYYAMDVSDFYNSARAKDLLLDMDDSEVASSLFAANLYTEGTGSHVLYRPACSEMSMVLGHQKTKVYLRSTPLFRLDKSRDYKIINVVDFNSLFRLRKSNDEKNAIAIEMMTMEASGTDYSTLCRKQKKTLSYLIIRNQCQIRDVFEQKNSSWLRSGRNYLACEALKEAVVSGSDIPHSDSQAGRILMRLKSGCYKNDDLVRFINRHQPLWLKYNIFELERYYASKELIDLAKSGSFHPPSTGSKAGRLLNTIRRFPKQDLYGISDALREVAPHWLEGDKVLSTRLFYEQRLINMAMNGMPPPVIRSRERWWLKYLMKNPQDDVRNVIPTVRRFSPHFVEQVRDYAVAQFVKKSSPDQASIDDHPADTKKMLRLYEISEKLKQFASSPKPPKSKSLEGRFYYHLRKGITRDYFDVLPAIREAELLWVRETEQDYKKRLEEIKKLHLEGYSGPEIAKMIGKSHSVVCYHIQRLKN